MGITVKIRKLPPGAERTAMGLVECGCPPVKAWYKIQREA